tara:strand:- start:66 stop:518 length:453 start_codon:yes stop_codon:yes gene_type:complete
MSIKFKPNAEIIEDNLQTPFDLPAIVLTTLEIIEDRDSSTTRLVELRWNKSRREALSKGRRELNRHRRKVMMDEQYILLRCLSIMPDQSVRLLFQDGVDFSADALTSCEKDIIADWFDGGGDLICEHRKEALTKTASLYKKEIKAGQELR